MSNNNKNNNKNTTNNNNNEEEEEEEVEEEKNRFLKSSSLYDVNLARQYLNDDELDDDDNENNTFSCNKYYNKIRYNKNLLGFIAHIKNINRYIYYMQHAKREMFKRKFNFCVGCCSIFIVVFVTAIAFTMIASMPAVFLQQGETTAGQIDVTFLPEYDVTGQYRINYTQLADNLNVHEEFQYHSPRGHIHVSQVLPQQCNDKLNSISNHMGPNGINEINWRYTGIPSLGSDYTCSNTSYECITKICGEFLDPYRKELVTVIQLMNSKREERMSLGRYWPYGSIPRGEALIEDTVANSYNLKAGSVVWLTINMRYDISAIATNRFLKEKYNNEKELYDFIRYIITYHSTVVIPIKVMDVFSSDKGKFPNNDAHYDNVIILEYEELWPYVLEQINPIINKHKFRPYNTSNTFITGHELLDDLNSMNEVAREVVLNLPPSRTDVYLSSNYDTIQGRLINFASRALYFGGFSELHIHMWLLRELRLLRFFTLYLGLILSIVLTILCVLATMLIYSLLMISIESRTFELGIHRMMGMTRISIIEMLLIQACSYSIPAWSSALLLAQWIVSSLLQDMENSVEVPLSKLLTPNAIGLATFLGLVIPMIASIFPIRKALKQNLYNSLDTRHSKTIAVKTSIERSEDERSNTALFAFGCGLVIFGFMIYYLLPLSLLSFNLALFFNIFFGILLGMLFGLILLAMNLQALLEKLIVNILLWWERRSVRSLVSANLTAHRLRNRKTSMMYALALGFIIFITVSFLLELKTAEERTLLGMGAPITIGSASTSEIFSYNEVVILEEIINKNKIVEDFAWQSETLSNSIEFLTNSEDYDIFCTNRGHVQEGEVNIIGVSPNYYDVLMSRFLRISGEDKSTGLSLSEQLYTVRGTQSMIVPSGFSESYDIHDLSIDSSVLLIPNIPVTRQNKSIDIQQIRPLAYLDQSPALSMSRFPTEGAQDVAVSFPTFMRLSNGTINTVDKIPLTKMYLKLKDSVTNKEIDDLKTQIGDSGLELSIDDIRDLQEALKQTRSTMILVFGIATVIALLLCIFSLMASMFTNIYEQAKEVAILRAIGTTRGHVIIVFVYEAFILVVSASFLGICIGVLMAWSMMTQRVLFTQLPVSVDFPYQFIVIIIVCGGICGMLSSFEPARQLVKQSIAQVFRTVV